MVGADVLQVMYQFIIQVMYCVVWMLDHSVDVYLASSAAAMVGAIGMQVRHLNVRRHDILVSDEPELT